jgi:hypothetical protein
MKLSGTLTGPESLAHARNFLAAHRPPNAHSGSSNLHFELRRFFTVVSYSPAQITDGGSSATTLPAVLTSQNSLED